MKRCEECGKKLGFLGGYFHPVLGKEHLLCSNCFDIVFESIEKYKEFITPYIGFFNKESSINKKKKTIKNIIPSYNEYHTNLNKIISEN